LNFRYGFIAELVKQGHKVQVIVPDPPLSALKINGFKIECLSYPLIRNRINPFYDIKTLFSLILLFRKINPDIVISFSIKPVIYSGLAVYFNPKIKFYSVITGLGYSFYGKSLFRILLKETSLFLYKIALAKAKKVVFQNIDNLNYFNKKGVISSECSILIHGSGVNIDYFKQTKLPNTKNVTFIMVSRLIKEKGVIEYIEAAKIVKKEFPKAIFCLLGSKEDSMDAVDFKIIKKNHNNRNIFYCGFRNDIRNYIKNSHVFVLPSYHEGMPKSSLEAMSMGRPLITTNVSGCRDTVVNMKNGILVEARNSSDLSSAMIYMIKNRSKLKLMGNLSRRMAAKKFEINKINSKLLRILN